MSKKQNSEKLRFPAGLFLTGLFTNIVHRHFFLTALALFLLVAGIWRTWCLYGAAGLFAVILARSLSQQIKFRREVLYGHDPKMRALRKAILSGDWKSGLQAWAESQGIHNGQ